MQADLCTPSSTCNCSDINGGQLCAEVNEPEKDRRFLISGAQEIVEILGGVLAVLFLVGLFVIFRKRICKRAGNHKPAPQEDPDLKQYISRDIGVGTQGAPMELNLLSSVARNQLDAEGQSRRNNVPELLTFCKPQGTRGPAVCSVAPNLPPAPPSSSDNESIAKNNWDCEESSKCFFHLLKYQPQLDAKGTEGSNSCKALFTLAFLGDLTTFRLQGTAMGHLYNA